MINNFLQQKYKLLNILEYGAFSTVHLALNQENNEKVILKEIIIKKNDLTKKLSVFEREAKILSQINHDNIPEFYEIFKIETENETKIYLVQEYIEGDSLANLIKGQYFFNEEDVLKIALEITGVLEYLHGFSPPVIHRDIKPENIIYSIRGKAYLIDFGAVIDELLHEKMKVQGLSTIIGTQSYMPFEQMRGKAVIASDFYSLGLSLIYILSHKPPHQIETNGLYLDFKAHVNISKKFYKLLKKMIEPDWKKRYQNASELKKEILLISEKVKNNIKGYFPNTLISAPKPENKTNENKESGMPDIQQKTEKNLIKKDFPENSTKINLSSSLEVLENIENLNNRNEILIKIALQENLSIREQDLLIAIAANKITDENEKYEVFSGLINNRYLRQEIIKTLITNIYNGFSNEILKESLITKLIMTHDLSTQEQSYLILKTCSKIISEKVVLSVIQALIGYRFLTNEILSELIQKIAEKFNDENNKMDLLKKINDKHNLAPSEQKLFIEVVMDNFSSEENKVSLLKLFINRQYPNKNINLFIIEKIKRKLASETSRKAILDLVFGP